MRRLATRLLVVAAVAATVAALVGCTRPSVPHLLSSARAQLHAGQPEAALIELKNVLTREPASAEARFLLGQTLLGQGQAQAALVELEKAASLGQEPAQVWPPIARAMLALAQFKPLIDGYEHAVLPAGDAAADLQTSVAAAYAAQGQRAQGADAVLRAVRLSPGYAPAVLLQVRLLAAGGDLDAAQGLLDTLLVKEAQNAYAWQLQGDLLSRRAGGGPAAAQAYRRSLDLRPAHVPSHAGLVMSLLRSGEVAAARRQADAMRVVLHADPMTAYVDAEVALAAGDAPKARALSLTALRGLPEHPRLLQMAGLTALQMGAPLQAEPPLLKSLQHAPEAALTRRLLASAYLATGQPGKLEAVLEPLLLQADAPALLLLAQARQQAGQTAAAQALLQRVQAVQPAAPEAQALLVEAQIAGRQFDAALATIARMDARQPGQPATAQLRGRLRLAQRDLAGARAAFEQAVALSSTYVPAALALAALDAQAGQTAPARARLDALLLRRPAEAAPALALAALLDRDRDRDRNNDRNNDRDRSGRVRTLLAGAVRDHPGDPRAQLAYAEHLRRGGDRHAAELALQDAAASMTGNAELLDALARLQLAEREFGQALQTLSKLLPLRPGAIEPLLRKAEAHIALGDTAMARQALKRVLVLRPGWLPAQRGLVSLALLDRQPEAALALARQVQQQSGALGMGLLLEGDVLVASGNSAGAAAVYLDGLRRAPGTELAAKAHATLLALGQTASAATLATDWRRSHPRDADFLVHLGNAALQRSDAAAAEGSFQKAVALQPLHGLALNNLATAMLALGHAGALPYAERAAALLPDSAEVLDTLASALLAERQPERALDVQRRAVALAPRNAALQPLLLRLQQAVAIVKPAMLR